MSGFRFEKLKPVCLKNKRIDRSVCDVSGRTLVLFHKHGKALGPHVESNFGEQMRALELGPVEEISENDWTWCRAERKNFNCHALAIGSNVGLTPDDWLEGKASPATLQQNPVQILLDLFFLPVEGDIQDNDVFVLRDSVTEHLVHSGFVRWIDDELVVVSKFGEGPILATGLDLIATVFQGSFDEIDWFRFRE